MSQFSTSVPLGPTGTSYAGVGSRFGAYLLDVAIGAVVWVPVYAIQLATLSDPYATVSGGAVAAVMVLSALGIVLSIVQWGLVATKGGSLGKLMVGIAIVDADTGRPIGWGRAFVRQLVLALLAAPCGIGLLIQPFVIPGHPRRQGWHDRAVNTVVVRGRPLRRDAAAPRSSAPRSSAPRSSAPPPYLAAAPPSLATEPPVAPPAPPSVGTPATPAPPPYLAPTAPAASAPPPIGPTGMVPPPPGVPLAAPPPMSPVPPAVSTPSAGAFVDESTRLGPVPEAPPRWRLVGAQSVEVVGRVVVGREPAAGEGETAHALHDPHRSMSKTHAALTTGPAGLHVEDLDSTNGVYVDKDGVETRLEPRTPTLLEAGTTVLLGDVAFRVERLT
ncbi:RDD family protein [Nocardioides sp.]|uniref:RDD family protein n=1 Tax=Nocardioides sp. TaxID=35761 RepID=UPI0039E3A64F